jgi:hypothetical protein
LREGAAGGNRGSYSEAQDAGVLARPEELDMHLNHTLVAARDHEASAAFLAELLALPVPARMGPFAIVHVDADTSLDYIQHDGAITPQHYAFLVTEAEFDDIFARIRQRGLVYWADPGRRQRGEINHWDDGRGVYFDDPNGHLLGLITRPYGSGPGGGAHPHPLLAADLRRAVAADR